MKKILCVLMSCLLFVMAGCSGHSKNLKFGAADIGGVYYSIASTFTQLADKEIDGYTFETKTTAGSVANLRLISDGYIDLAIVQADLLSDAYNATGTFTDKKYQKGYKAVAFDIFDTLLKRDCAHPADLFALMEVTHQAALGFAGARAAAEAETRQTLGREVTLAEIYAHPALRGTDPATECAAELAMIAPNRPVAQAAAACHARGQKVYAVSDM